MQAKRERQVKTCRAIPCPEGRDRKGVLQCFDKWLPCDIWLRRETMRSVVTLCKVKSSRLIPLLTLAPPADDKSMISRHFPSWPFLGMTPKLLMCNDGKGRVSKGPATLPKDTSLAKYSSITIRCSYVESLLGFVWYAIIVSSSHLFFSNYDHTFGKSLASIQAGCSSRTLINFSTSSCFLKIIFFFVFLYSMDASLVFIFIISHSRFETRFTLGEIVLDS